MGTIQNITPKKFRRFLKAEGLSFIGIEGGHEKWAKPGMLRPVIFQTHISPIPERVLRSNLSSMGLTRKDIENYLIQK